MRPLRTRSPRRLLAAAAAAVGLVVALPLALAGPASAATQLHGRTTVTTAPGLAKALLHAGVVPLPARGTTVDIADFSPLQLSYGFPITGGNPDLAGPSGDINHRGGIEFVSRRARLEIGRFDIDLAAGKVFATEVNHAPARIAVLDLDLSGLKVTTPGHRTVLSGIVVRLDPAAAGALNATFHLGLPTDGSLVFGTARVVLR